TVHVRDNPVLVVEGSISSMPVIAHLGVGSAGHKAIQRHAHGFGIVEHADLPASIRSIVPSRLPSNDSHGDVLLQSRLPGSNLSLKQMSEVEFRNYVERTLQLVLGMRPTCRHTAQGPDQEFIHEKLLPIPELLPPELGQYLGLGRDLLKRWPSRRALPAGLVHGDLWLSNVLFDEFGRPSGLVDWEWSRDQGLPAYDALYLILMAISERRGVGINTCIPAIWDKSMRDEWLDAMLQKVSETFGLTSEDLTRIAILVWFGTIRRSAIDTTGTSSGWLESMICPVADRLRRYMSGLAAVH
ncbi:MAG TPA: phosphotransferase, partial [Rhizorhapis sp.]|nr:phosphotransferase [Rhizorhapis sp.]